MKYWVVGLFLIGLIENKLAWGALAASEVKEASNTRCPALYKIEEIQNQFQIFHHASSQFPQTQEKELKALMEMNQESLKKFSCYFDKGQDPKELGDILAVLKLQILQLRYATFKKDRPQMEIALKNLNQMKAVFLEQPSLLARRLGASVRSLFLDELELLIETEPELVRQEVEQTSWISKTRVGLEKEITMEWQTLRDSFSGEGLLSAPKLAQHFGRRPWTAAPKESLPFLQLMSRWKSPPANTLESQLLVLFKKNSRNFLLTETETAIKHYLVFSIDEMKRNPYFILKSWLDPVIEARVQTLKKELGSAWPLVSPLVGVQLEGPFQEIKAPIELLGPPLLGKATEDYQKVRNPLGRLYEIVFLKRITQMWTQVDVTQLRSDLNRLNALKTVLAMKTYQKHYAQWPASMEDLVQKKLLPELPKDHFSGKPLQYDSAHQKVWSVGENGIDEKGQGDDMTLKVF